jgi:hypothetical protein
MNTLVLLFLAILFAIFLKIKFHRKELCIKKRDRTIFVNDVEVEYSDMQHYIDTKKNFEDRRNIINNITEPAVDIVQNDLKEEVPDIINYHVAEDTQNVHDNAVQKNLKKTYESVLKTQQPLQSCKEEIINFITDEATSDKVLDIIEKIEKRNAFVTNLDSNEEDVLKNVWFSGNNNVKTQLINEILDCVDSGDMLYCPTGVTSRLSSALHIESPEKAPKTKEILNQEIMTTFGKHYTDTSSKSLAKERTIDDYYSVYPREMIQESIEKWIDHI